MNRIFISLIVVVATIAGLLMYQASQTGTSLVLLPADLLSPVQGRDLSRIRVAGRVTSDPIEYQMEPALLKFRISAPGGESSSSVPVVYKNLKPDMFASGRDVIVDGEFKNGELVASNLLTQCPSKYEPPNPTDVKYQ